MACTACSRGIITRRGDDTNALGIAILFNLNTDLDLTGYTAVFQVNDLRYTWDDITSKRLEMHFTREQTMTLPVGTSYGALKIYDNNGLAITVKSNIPVRVQRLMVDNEV